LEEQQAKEIANFRYRLIAPIVSRDNLLPGELKSLIEEAASKTYLIPYSNRSKVSTRSIERYLAEYRRGGFLALMPGRRTGRRSRVPQKYLDQALLLKKENPRRSIRQIITTLELAGKIPPGALKKSTVYDYLEKHGLARRFLKRQTQAYQRYQAKHRNQRWQGDTCHLLYLPDPPGSEKKKKVYLIAWLDDYSRMVAHAQCYFFERLPMLEDSFKKAILKYGQPEQIYVDYAEEKTMPKKAGDAPYTCTSG